MTLWRPEGIDYETRRASDGYVQPRLEVEAASRPLSLAEVTLRGGYVASEIAIERHRYTAASEQHELGQYAIITDRMATADGVRESDFLTTNVNEETSKLVIVQTSSVSVINTQQANNVVKAVAQSSVSTQAQNVTGTEPKPAEPGISQQEQDSYIPIEPAAYEFYQPPQVTTGQVQSTSGGVQQTVDPLPTGYGQQQTGTAPLQNEQDYGSDPFWSYLDPYTAPASNDPYIGGSLGF